MGRNKDIRKHIEGHERNIWKHKLKIENELRSDFPRADMLKKWESDIKRAEATIRILRERLKRRRKNAASKKSSTHA